MFLSSLFFTFLLRTTLLPKSARAEVTPQKLSQIHLPPNFSISLFTDQVKGARSLAQNSAGVLFVGTRDQSVYAVIPNAKDGKPQVLTVAQNLHSPNGVAYHEDALYVAEISRIIRYDQINEWIKTGGKTALKYTVVRDDFPSDEHHGWKFIRIGPDGSLYVPVGAPCNICEPDPTKYAALFKVSLDGKKRELVAQGIRNTVGFDWQPKSAVLYFTDNGRDLLGDDQPTDELNKVSQASEHFGYPYCHQGDLPDPEFGAKRKCSEFTAPVRKLTPHGAALGMRFYEGQSFPNDFQEAILIAEHGSWNRTTPIGYRLMRVRLAGPGAPTYDVFADGWLQGKDAWGRPVDVEVRKKDGALYVSDDLNGAIYLIQYKK